MPIETSPTGAVCMTGHGDLPHGGISYYVLLTAWQAASLHVKTNGRIKLTRTATVGNIRATLNRNYPNRPDGPFTGRTMKRLLAEIVHEIKRQRDLLDASKHAEQIEALDRCLTD